MAPLVESRDIASFGWRHGGGQARGIVEKNGSAPYGRFGKRPGKRLGKGAEPKKPILGYRQGYGLVQVENRFTGDIWIHI